MSHATLGTFLCSVWTTHQSETSLQFVTAALMMLQNQWMCSSCAPTECCRRPGCLWALLLCSACACHSHSASDNCQLCCFGSGACGSTCSSKTQHLTVANTAASGLVHVGALLTLQGPGAYDAAVHCASVSAARRIQQQRDQPPGVPLPSTMHSVQSYR